MKSLSPGDAMSMTLGFDAADVAPNAILAPSSIVAFSLNAGTVQRNDPSQLVPDGFPAIKFSADTLSLSQVQLDNQPFSSRFGGAGSDPVYYGASSFGQQSGMSVWVSDSGFVNSDFSQPGSFDLRVASVPGPVVGAGLPGLLGMLGLGGFKFWRRKKVT